ncbi:Sperm-tail PG-rich repeat-containing protein [Dirofilaria immitis]
MSAILFSESLIKQLLSDSRFSTIMNSTLNVASKLNTDDDFMKNPSSRSKGSRSAESNENDSTPSPPSYAVFEDKYGNLVNRGLNVIWPIRPNHGRYSLNEYRKQKQRLQEHSKQRPEYRRRSEKCRQCMRQSGRQSDILHAHTSGRAKDDNDIYIGVQSLSSLRPILRPTEFRLFYMRPESMNSFNQMPIKMPLMLAYMSSSGKIYNFNFKRYQYNSGTFWQLDLSNIEGPKQPIFHSISALVQHYKSFVIDRGDGRLEVFPVD